MAPMRWSFRQTPTRHRVGVGSRLVSRVSHRMREIVTLATLVVKRYTPPISTPERAHDGCRPDSATRAHPRPREVLPAAGAPRFRGSRRPRRADGARARGRPAVAHQG